MDSEIEKKRNQLNLLIIKALMLMDLVDKNKQSYDNYTEGSLAESDFLDQQIKLVSELIERFQNVFK